MKGKKDLRGDRKTSRDKPRGISDQIPYVLKKIDTKAILYPLYIEADSACSSVVCLMSRP